MSGYFKRMAHLAKVSAIAPRHSLSNATGVRSVIIPDVAVPTSAPNNLNAQPLPSTDPSSLSSTRTDTNMTQSASDSEALTSQPTQSARESTTANRYLKQTSTNNLATTATNKANYTNSRQKQIDTTTDVPGAERAITPSSLTPQINPDAQQPLHPVRQSSDRKVGTKSPSAPEAHTNSTAKKHAVSLSNTQSIAQRAISKATPESNTLESPLTSSPESTPPPIPGVRRQTELLISPRRQETTPIATPETEPIVQNIPIEQPMPVQPASNSAQHLKTPAAPRKVDVNIGAINISMDPEPHAPPQPPAPSRVPTPRVGGIWSGRRSLARSYVRRV